ncbi:hypothetical protein [Thalassorhabdomicrobium marinisediminis]|uniref:hypothetical protein n=1 Tax=Thalassorhabdomicrobium marinisediminis TaxID=2170577 RepID=UPI002490C128|nr:hypothetical protein [Thalassorhabdomicrobium marinisediminis]
MKKISKMIRQIGRRYAMAKKITEFDRRADARSNPEESGLAAGHLKLPIDDLFETPGLTAQLQAHPKVRVPPGAKRVHFEYDLPAFVWDAALNSSKLQGLARDYLGPDVRIDNFYIKNVADGLSSGSEGWHTDNVGYRLKVFMVFDTEGDPSGTVLIPQERPNLYTVALRDEVGRALNRPMKEDRTDAVRVAYAPGDCLVFDTNLPHRGDYSSGEGVRYCMVLELIDRNKADVLHGKSPCGPGQGGKKLRIPQSVSQSLENHPLIDQRILTRDGEGILYGY